MKNKLRLPYMAFCLLLCASLHAYAQSAAPATADPNAELNLALDGIFHTELLMTVGEAKPFSTASDKRKECELARLADEQGTISNPDLEFFVDPDGACAAVNYKAANRLSKDKTVKALFKKYGYALPATHQQWLADYLDAYSQRILPWPWPHLLIGVFYGYPPLEAERFAVDIAEERVKIADAFAASPEIAQAMEEEGAQVKPQAPFEWMEFYKHTTERIRQAMSPVSLKASAATPRIFVRTDTPGFESCVYARFSRKELERDDYFLGAHARLAKNYLELRKTHTPLEIINHPQWLGEGVPPFPAHLLEQEAAQPAPATAGN